MKTYPIHRSRRGFTLIELLVVITIVAALAALSFAGIQLAQQRVRETQTQNMVTGISRAVEDFFSEYNRLPDFDQDEIQTDSAEGIELIEILMAKENDQAGDIENKRRIPFLTLKDAKGRRNGVDIDPNTGQVQGVYDSWGQPLIVRLNLEYEDEMIFDYGQAGNRQQVRLRNKQVAVYSLGANGVEGEIKNPTSWD